MSPAWQKAIKIDYFTFSGVSFSSNGDKAATITWSGNVIIGYIFVFNVITGTLEMCRTFSGAIRAFGLNTQNLLMSSDRIIFQIKLNEYT